VNAISAQYGALHSPTEKSTPGLVRIFARLVSGRFRSFALHPQDFNSSDVSSARLAADEPYIELNIAYEKLDSRFSLK